MEAVRSNRKSGWVARPECSEGRGLLLRVRWAYFEICIDCG